MEDTSDSEINETAGKAIVALMVGGKTLIFGVILLIVILGVL